MGDVITKRTVGRAFAALAVVALGLAAALAGSSAPSVRGNTHQGDLRRLAYGTAVPAEAAAAAAAGAALEIKHGARVAPAIFDGSLRTLPHAAPRTPRVVAAPEREAQELGQKQALPGEEPSRSMAAPSAPAPDPSISFKGLDFTNWGDGWPPDTVGDVGPTHFVQAVNTSVGIFRKSDGVRLTAFTFNTLWSAAGTGTACDTDNFGDPTVIYDPLGDRWIVADFAFVGSGTSPPFYECIAVSRTSDPVGGGWYLYAIRTDDTAHPWFADYPKMGIWPDGLYMTANMFQGNTYREVRVWAFNRSDLESGVAVRNLIVDLATTIRFSLLPSNMRTAVGAPPAGRDNLLVSESESLFAFEVFKFHVDYSGSGSSFTGPTNVSQASYTGAPSTVPSPGNALDSLSERLMMQAQYTNIGGTESLWVNHTVRCCGGTSPAGIQWAQINVTGGTVATTPVQQQLYPPANDGLHRWMGSLAVDKSGGMALGYSVSSSTTNPDIRYAGRLSSDPLNTLPRTEKTMLAGVTRGTQSGRCSGSRCVRWGDYSAMTIDPDGCRFWYTQEYYEATGIDWQTRIASFSFPSCGNGKTDQTITFDGPTAKTFGDPDFTVSATASSGLRVSFAAGGNCTVSESTVHITGGGSCTITASQPGDSTYNAAPDVARTVAIAKANQTISFGALAGKAYGDPDFTVSATASSGLSVSFAPSGNCTQTGATVHITGAGSCTVTASQAGNSNYNAAPSAPQTFSIAKASQAITFPAIADKTLGAANFDPGATASSGLAVGYAATGPCSIVGTQVHVTGAGSCTVTASQSGNSNYAAAVDVAQSFSIKSTQSITFDSLPAKTYGEPDFTISASASSGLPVSFSAGGNCTVSGSTVHITGAGSCTITASQAGNSTYNAAPDVARTFSIAKANQTITFGALAGKTYGDPDFTVSATASSGLPVSFARSGNCTVTGVTVHITGAGSCTVTASQLGDANYNAAPGVPRAFSIAKAGQTITFPAILDTVVGAGDFDPGATASSGLAVGYAATGPCSIVGTQVHVTGAGSCTVTASQSGDSNYAAAADVARSFSSNSTQTITFDSLPAKTYGDPDFAVSASASSGLSVSFVGSGNCNVSGLTVHLTGAGSCTVTASQAGNSNYFAAPDVARSFSIAKASQTILFGVLAGKTFGDPDFAVGVTSSSGLPVTFLALGNCVLAGSTVGITGAGSCTVTASQPGDMNYAAATLVSQTFAIAKASQTIAFGALADKRYGAADFTIAATASSGLAVSFTGSGSCTMGGGIVHLTGVGACTVTASQPGDANYSAAPDVAQSFTIARPPLTPASTCRVPKVVGKSLPAAKLALKQRHCRTGTVGHAYSRKIKTGIVSSQSRRAGRVLPANSKVNLVVSRGRRP